MAKGQTLLYSRKKWFDAGERDEDTCQARWKWLTFADLPPRSQTVLSQHRVEIWPLRWSKKY